jgi:hypothetical protein
LCDLLLTLFRNKARIESPASRVVLCALAVATSVVNKKDARMKTRYAMLPLLVPGILMGPTAPASAGETPAPAPQIVKTSTLPAIGLKEFQQPLLPGVSYVPVPTPPDGAAADRNVDLGGIGSDLFRAAGTSTNEFYAITDRGPNGEADVSGATRRTFPVPWFDPTILHVRASGPRMDTLRAIPVVGGPDCSVPVGGLPNLGGTVTSPADGLAYDDPPYAYDAFRRLDYAQSGLDTEGLVRTPNGEFWFAEEYSPSIGRLDENGCVIERIVPNGLPLTNAGYPVVGDSPATEADRAIPAIYQLRKRNRGFEALALTSSGRYLYVGLQSPLLNPTTAAGNAAYNTRILRYNLQQRVFDAEYVYRFQPEGEFEPDTRPRDLKVSAIVALDDDTLLVLERTDVVAKIFLVELARATNILGTWDCVGGTTAKAFLGGVAVPVCSSATTGAKSIEQMVLAADLAGNGITSVVKTRLVAEIDSRSGLPGKIEGMAVLNPSQIAVANDNDFNVKGGGLGEAFGADGNMILRSPPVPSQILRIKLAQPLPAGS